MKKNLILFFLLFISTNITFAAKAIPTLQDGMILKCEAKKSNGSIKEYTSFTDYYEYKNGKFYSQNLSKMFGNPNYKKKVLKLQISENTIYFKDRLYRWKASYFKWMTIDRNTGRCTFNAKRERPGYYQTARGTGMCTVLSK